MATRIRLSGPLPSAAVLGAFCRVNADLQAELDRKDALICELSARLGTEPGDGLASLRRLRCLEDALDLAREFFAGKVPAATVKDALDRARRA